MHWGMSVRTGAVNTHVTPQGAQGQSAAPSTATPPPMPAQTQLVTQTQSAASTVLSAFSRTDRDRIFGVDIRQTDDADRGLTPETVRDIQRLASLLALFFVAIIMYVAWSSYSEVMVGQQNKTLDRVSSEAVELDARLGNAVAWTDTAMSAPSPQRMVGVASRGAGVAGSAFVDGDGTLVFAVPAEAGAFLAQAASGERNSASVEIKRVVAENGDINPVIVRQTPTGKLITALGTQTLLSQVSGTSALVSPTGLVIDGPRQIALEGALGGFDMDESQLARLTNSPDIRRVDGWKINDRKVWLAAAVFRIQTSLSFMLRRAVFPSPRF